MTDLQAQRGFYPRSVLLLLSLAAVYYLVIFRLDPVGSYHDDAMYICGAQSLLKGSFAKPYLVGTPIDNDRLPGYSLWLAPFVAICQPHWSLLKFVSWATVLASTFLLWRLGRQYLSPPLAAAVAGLFAFNPVSATLAHSVLAEPNFVLLMLAAFLWLGRLQTAALAWEAPALGALLGWAALTRPEGFLLIIGAALAFRGESWRDRRWLSVLVPALIFLSFLARNFAETGTASFYATQYQQTLAAAPGGALDGLLFTNASLLKLLFYFPFSPNGRTGLAYGVPLGAGLAALLVVGGVRCLRSSAVTHQRRLTEALIFFALGYWIVHLFWPAYNGRYFWPLLPFLLLFGAAGWQTLREKGRPWRAALWVIPVALIVSYLDHDSFQIHQAWRPISVENKIPWETYRWLKNETPPESQVLSVVPATTYLYSHRRGLDAVAATNADELWNQLTRAGIVYILFKPYRILSLRSPKFDFRVMLWRDSFDWVRTSKDFRLVYSNPNEGTAVFAVSNR